MIDYSGFGQAVRLWTRRDAGIAVLVLAVTMLGGVAATRAFVTAGHLPTFYQEEFGPAVLSACGWGFRNSPDAASLPQQSPLSAFLHQQSESFDCASLTPEIALVPFNAFQTVHGNLIGLAALVWRITGVSWPSLAWLGGLFAGVSGAAAYLFFRTAMSTALAVLFTTLWVTSPLHLEQIPHLRDYSKTPFFAVLLCAVMWAARATSSRAITIAVMAALGAFFGIGLGIRTDVAIYLPIVIAALFFRSPWTRPEILTRLLAAAAALAMFAMVAAPVLRGYQRGNNIAHVAILGLTDPSRDWLRLQSTPYSYGYLYHDLYAWLIIAAEAERQQPRTESLSLGSADYATWGSAFYGKLLRTFPGDMLTRSWAAVRGVLGLPFVSIQLRRPPWFTGLGGQLLDWRGAIVKQIAIIPPVATAIVALAILGAANLRLALFAGVLFALLAGSTAVQFQGRHVFQFEILSWCVLGFVVSATWQFWRGSIPRAAYPHLLKRAAIVTFVLVLSVAAPIAAARHYQSSRAEQLLTVFAEAPTEPVETVAVPAARDSDVLLRIVPPVRSERRFIDTDVIAVTFGGEQCDADAIGVTFRYVAKPQQADVTRYRHVVMPPPGPQRTRILFPTYSSGERSADPSALKFVGVELARAYQPCVVDVRRVARPELLPMFMETLLTPDWRTHPLYEAMQDVEPKSDEAYFESYGAPDGMKPGRRWLASLEQIRATPTFRSSQVKDLEPGRIESRGRDQRPGAYLLSWPYEPRQPGSAFYVEGELFDGGLTIGIQQNETWVKQLNVDAAGKFRAVIRVDAAGSYGAVLANHQIRGSHHSVVTRYGWLPPAP